VCKDRRISPDGKKNGEIFHIFVEKTPQKAISTGYLKKINWLKQILAV
jgi:hypothetical protein